MSAQHRIRARKFLNTSAGLRSRRGLSVRLVWYYSDVSRTIVDAGSIESDKTELAE